MVDVGPYMSALSTGAEVAKITGKASDSLPSGSYSAFIYSITGRTPTVIKTGDNKVKLILSEDQAKMLRKWIESKLLAVGKADPNSSVSYEIGPAINPVIAKYTIPTALSLFAAGILTAYLMR